MMVVGNGLRVAVVGATGAVGQEFLRLFEERNFPVESLRLFASHRSAGKTLEFMGEPVIIEDLDGVSFDGLDVVFLSAGASRSREVAPKALAAGAVVIDNSSAFRLDEGVPLIVPEVNGEKITSADRLLANPNCTAAILLMAVKPLLSLGRITRIVMSTYQCASGAGAQAMEELRTQTAQVLRGEEVTPKVMPHPYAFNLFSHNTAINEDGYNDEEAKVVAESRKMLGLPTLSIGVTCVRVPIMRAHAISATLEFEGTAPDVGKARAALNEAPGVRVVDDREQNHFPMPLEASGIDDVLVGRIRRDLSHPQGLSLFIAGDQLLKGAALNAVQIAELMISKGYLAPNRTPQ